MITWLISCLKVRTEMGVPIIDMDRQQVGSAATDVCGEKRMTEAL
jgi:hypothetical protein